MPNSKDDGVNSSKDPEDSKKSLNHDKTEQKIEEKSLEIDLVKITDGIIKGDPKAKDELKLHIKRLKNEIREKSEKENSEFKHLVELGELGELEKSFEEMSTELFGINGIISQVKKAFEGKSWLAEIQKSLDEELIAISKRNNSMVSEEEIKRNILETAQSAQRHVIEGLRERLQLENKRLADKQTKDRIKVKSKPIRTARSKEQIKTLVSTLKEAGAKALRERSFDKAIDILKETETKIIPIIVESELISADEGQNLKLTILEELRDALIQKGQIDDAIKVIDSQYQAPKYKNEKYRHSQIKKSHLLVQSGEFRKGISLLEKLLDNCCGDKIEYGTSAEIKRALGMAYRGKGAYDDALKYFQESQVEFKKVNDFFGYHNALWGQGILHYLRGEWEEALSIWDELKAYFTDYDPTYLIKIYFEYMRTYKLTGDFQKARLMLNNAQVSLKHQGVKERNKYSIYIHLAFAELHYLQNELDEARKSIQLVRSLIRKPKDVYFELSILEVEIDILCALDEYSEARKKLKKVYKLCKSNWDFVKYYRLLGKTEKHEMNYGKAQRAFKSAISLTDKIGALSYSDKLALTELLIEMAKIGNTKAIDQAKLLLKEIEDEIFEKNLPSLQLELKLQKGYLAWGVSRFEDAYYIFSEIVEEANVHRLFRQKRKALDALNTLEQQGQNLRTSTKTRSVFRYLDDARRIMEEFS